MAFEVTKLFPVKTAAKCYADWSLKSPVDQNHHKERLKVWSNYKAYVDWTQMAMIAITIGVGSFNKKKAEAFYYGKKLYLSPMVKASFGGLFLVKVGKIVAVFFKTYHKILSKKDESQS